MEEKEHHHEQGSEHYHEHGSEHHEHHTTMIHEEKKSKSKAFYWQVATAVLIILLVISIFTGGLTFNPKLSKDEAAANTIKYINEKLLQGQAVAELASIEEKDGLYNIKLRVNGQEVNGYVTSDGKLFFPTAIPLTETAAALSASNTPTPAPSSVPKSDKPKVELFVMSHCPFGTQAEKGILPVIGLLKDKADFDIKFVYYAMHGKKEVDEQMNQVCIKNEQKDRFYDYLKCFLKDGNGAKCLTEAKVDVAKLTACVKKLDKEYGVSVKLNDQSTWLSGQFPLFDVYKADNTKYQVGGSPTLVINGAEANSGRSPAAYLATVCGAFNTAPAECQQQLGAQQYAAGFGYELAGADAAAAAQCQ